MKNILKTTILAFFLISLGSCENDDTKPTPTANGLTLQPITPSGPYVLSAENGDNDVATFTWTATDNGVASIPSSYVIEIAKSGTDFAELIIASPSSTATTYVWKEGYLDPILLKNGFIPDVAVDIDIRIKSTLGLGSHPFIQYSNVFTATVTPFAQPSFAFTKEGGNPAEAPKLISSSLFTTDCEGYAWLEAGSYRFYTSVQNVYQTSNPYYGDNGSGALELNGNVINVATAGFYLIKADINLKTYSIAISEWGVFGKSTPNPFANNKKMTYNTESKKWEISILLKGGLPFQFRNQFKNTPETLILGLFDAKKVGVDYAGKDMSYNGIEILTPGNTTLKYKVTLDLNTPRSYTYTLVLE